MIITAIALAAHAHHHRPLLAEIELNEKGVRIDKIYHCPHVPEDNCECRKPKIALFLQAVRDFGLSLDKSWFIGDGPTDVIAGREANIKTIKIGARMPRKLKLEPHGYAKNLGDAISLVFDVNKKAVSWGERLLSCDT